MGGGGGGGDSRDVEEGGGRGRKGVREEEGRQDCKVRGRDLFGRWRRLRLQPAKVTECITFLPGHPPAHSHQRLEWTMSGMYSTSVRDPTWSHMAKLF